MIVIFCFISTENIFKMNGLIFEFFFLVCLSQEDSIGSFGSSAYFSNMNFVKLNTNLIIVAI